MVGASNEGLGQEDGAGGSDQGGGAGGSDQGGGAGSSNNVGQGNMVESESSSEDEDRDSEESSDVSERERAPDENLAKSDRVRYNSNGRPFFMLGMTFSTTIATRVAIARYTVAKGKKIKNQTK